MSNEIVKKESNTICEIEESANILNRLMKLPHYQKIGADQVFAMIMKAKSLNMDMVYALNGGLYCIKGKVGMPAEAMAAMIREKGHSITKDKASTDTCCILHGKRADNGDTWTCKFSIEDAKKAKIFSNVWESYPQAMVYNRAMSFLARQLFPDIIKGAGYTLDELKEIAGNKELQEVEFEEVKQVDEKISTEQVNELVKLLECFDDAFRKNWFELIKKEPLCAQRIEDLPLSEFEKRKNQLVDRIKKLPKKEIVEEKKEVKENLFDVDAIEKDIAEGVLQ